MISQVSCCDLPFKIELSQQPSPRLAITSAKSHSRPQLFTSGRFGLQAASGECLKVRRATCAGELEAARQAEVGQARQAPHVLQAVQASTPGCNQPCQFTCLELQLPKCLAQSHLQHTSKHGSRCGVGGMWRRMKKESCWLFVHPTQKSILENI